MHANVYTSSPMNFRWSRNKRHAMVMTHPAGVADRIDRSFSPRGEREERDLVSMFKETKQPVAASETYTLETRRHGVYCIARRPSLFRACLDDTFSV
jgi:hypothetical protein